MRQDRPFVLMTVAMIALVSLGCAILSAVIYIRLPKGLPAQAAAAQAPTRGPLPSRSARLAVPTPQLTDTLGSPTPPAVAVLAHTLTPGPFATQLPPASPVTVVPLPTHTLKPADTPLAPASPATAVLLPTATLKTIDAVLPTIRSSAITTALPTYTPKPTDTPQSPTPTVTAALLPPPAQPTDRPSPTATASPSPTAGVGTVGQRILAGGMGLTVVSVSKQSEFGPLYLILDVIIENVSRNEDVPYAPVDLSVEDSEGFQYSATYWVRYTTLESGTLATGGQARGNVAFEIDPAARGFVATYDPTELPGDHPIIQIGLEQ